MPTLWQPPEQGGPFAALAEWLSPEFGPEDADLFVGRLVHATGECPEKAVQLFYEVGLAWSPVLRHFYRWARGKAKYPIYRFMRDMQPLGEIPEATDAEELYANRSLIGVRDELAGTRTQAMDPLFQRYYEQVTGGKPATVLDSGCWGTVILALYRCGYPIQALFLYSHNPHIPGYFNECGVPDDIAQALNDAFECCLVKSFARPSQLLEPECQSGIIRPCLRQATEPLVIRLAETVLEGVRDRSRLWIPEEAAIAHLAEQNERAKQGIFTGFLGKNTPLWSEGEEFLANWPPKLRWD